MAKHLKRRIHFPNLNIVAFALYGGWRGKNADIAIVADFAHFFHCGANHSQYSFTVVDIWQITLLDGA